MDEDVSRTGGCLGGVVKLIALVFVIVLLAYVCVDVFQPSYESRTVSPVTIGSGEAIEGTYKWSYERCNWTWDVAISRELYDLYRVKERPETQDYTVYITHPDDDAYVELLADSLQQAACEAEYDKWETANFAASFVQSLPYVYDIETKGCKEYPRYPIETLVDGGDCEDTSILVAALLDKMGYGVVLLLIRPEEPPEPGHHAVGVEGDESVWGASYEHNGKRYFYLETTGRGWKIGDMPDEYKDKGAYIYDIIR